jgi:very-short-patch-repair endonuclease
MGGQPTARRAEERRKAFAARERRLAALAARQHGIVTRRQLLDVGLGPRTIERRVERAQLYRLHRGVYAYSDPRPGRRSRWLAAVLACGHGALLSHRSAAALWGILRAHRGDIDVLAPRGRGRPGIAVHEGGIYQDERADADGIPVTSVARTLLDLADVVDEKRLEQAFEEADRLGLLEMRAVEAVCARSPGRRGLKPLRRLAEEARAPEMGRSRLEDRVHALCREHSLPAPRTNVEVLGHEVDAYWPDAKVIVEADGWSFHRHRAAFERDRARDARLQVAGYHVVRLTHRRLEREPELVADELRRLLWPDPAGERGQGAVEWVALLGVVALLLAALLAAGARLPGASLARGVGSKLLCAAALAERCGDEPALIAAYGDELGRLARQHMPAIAFERGSRALPVDFRHCRAPACGDGSARGLVARTDRGLPVTAFVHVIDCRASSEEVEAGSPDCSGERAGNLYLQYWLYYADSATLRGVPLAEGGYHRDDWESVQVRIVPDGRVDERASSHRGYNHGAGIANAGSDAGVDRVREIAEALGARPRNGWGPAEGLLRVSGGSHAGNAAGYFDLDRIAPAPWIRLIPLEPVAVAAAGTSFAVSPPWRKRVWADPEASGTD